jgi:3-oxoacyl-[acyl-carrier-protein] synthase-1
LKKVFYIADNIICPLGDHAAAVYENILAGKTSVQQIDDATVSKIPFAAAQLSAQQMQSLSIAGDTTGYSPFEKLCIASIEAALTHTRLDIAAADTIIILSTTKGNIEWLGLERDERIQLYTSANIIGAHFDNPNRPVIISTACISGTLALITAKRLLENGRYKHAVVVGADRLSAFVAAGFQSFQALSTDICKPFDANRKGLNLGEAAATVVLSSEITADILIAGGAGTNDANHLSGPSRTGQELANAIGNALNEAGIQPEDVGMIAAHGTATPYNDEMEAKALQLAGVLHAPLYSIKANTGHTLGAAGVLESIIACKGLQHQTIIPSLGFEQKGVSPDVHIAKQPYQAAFNYVLKTASGFGGCNAALILARAE